MKCRTYTVGGTRTRTKYLPTHTCHVTKIVRPIATVEQTYTPRARTRTKVAVTISTETTTVTVSTNVVVSTSTAFELDVPTTTLTLAAYTPTSTEYEVLPPTTTLTATLTSYTAAAPAPSLAGGTRRRSDGADEHEVAADGRDASKRELTTTASAEPTSPLRLNFDGYAGRNPGSETDDAQLDRVLAVRGRRRGKHVVCTPKVKSTTTVTRRAKVTVTQTMRGRRPTVTITSTATATLTNTQYPTEVTSILLRPLTTTLRADPITLTYKPTAAAVTVTKTLDVRADAPEQTTVLDLYSICDPSRWTDLKYWKRTAGSAFQTDFSTGITPDAALCCQSVADTPGAVSWAWVKTPPDAAFVQGTCYGLMLNLLYDPARPDLSDQCVVGNPGLSVAIEAGANEKGGLLQCGASFT
ncbi:hypothetical protein OC842_007146 [Tilletia horrida]|uniref:Uncharacterized protein n=1 Tax=Tilletia horrida TaxID=155126 RepID=A0AAN6JH93_9BASI|nr:hypothetical protein OC842_007146 [Tilletia horrida]